MKHFYSLLLIVIFFCTFSSTIAQTPASVTGSSIGGTVFYDVNGNSYRNLPDDYGLSGWKIYLNMSGIVIDSSNTDASGSYTFTELENGNYTISQSNKPGWVRTFPLSPGVHNIIITNDTVITGKDFGNWPEGILRGIKFNDLNGNGIKETGEPPLQGWSIFLNGPINTIDTTDQNGIYEFLGLVPGTYAVSESLQLAPGWVQTLPETAYYSIPFIVGSRETRDFGNFKKVSISGQKFHDLDGNSVKDEFEEGLSDWMIYLITKGATKDSVITAGAGNYVFSDLGPGTYSLSEKVQEGWVQTRIPDSVRVTSGKDTSGFDFGNYHISSISGISFNDWNGDGSRDNGELGLEGWLVRLSGPQSDSVFTDATGSFSFDSLRPGNYTLIEIPMNNWILTTPETLEVSIISNTDTSGFLFGNYELGTITGTKFKDKNGNSIYDAGEEGIPGWLIRIDGDRIDSTYTDDTGNFSFTGLSQGSYSISEDTTIDGWKQTFPTPPDPSNYTLSIDTSGTIISNIDFGNFQLGTLSGLKFNDLNNNSTRDLDEPVIPGWKIRLSGARIDTVITDDDGKFSFSHLWKGTYFIRELPVTGWLQTYPSVPTYYTVIIDTSGISTDTLDFGNFQVPSISGVKFLDIDGNGVQDPGDSLLKGWRIRLSGSKVDSILTDTLGRYKFSNLSFGTYTLHECNKPGWIQITPNPEPIVIDKGVPIENIDFGNFKLGSISGTKFNDYNGNGLKDDGEAGLNGWKIYLHKSEFVIDSILTNTSGGFKFSNLGPGIYTLSEEVKSDWMQTYPPPPVTHDITMQSGLDTIGIDFGNFQLVSISGRKFHDLNGNGLKELGDTVMSECIFYLNETTVDTTDEMGYYTFNDLGPGVYLITEQQQNGWIRTVPPLDSAGYTIIINQSGVPITDKDFGNLLYSTISGRKFQDANGDAIEQPSERGLQDWVIELTGPLGVQYDTTDAAGKYEFTYLPGGTYILSEQSQDGWIQTIPSSVTPDHQVELTGGEIRENVNFGNFSLGIVTGLKYHDKNGNGVRNAGEEPLSGWEFELLRNDMVIADTLTGADGKYKFIGLSPGLYTIREKVKSGWVPTAPNTLGEFTDTMVAGGFDENKDFGNFKLGSITGQKFQDLNGDGIKGINELGYAGWIIQLSGKKVDTDTTDEDGYYTFDSLLAGQYTVSESPDIYWTQTYPPPPGTHSVLMRSGLDTTGLDFGNFINGSINGTVCFDKNYNGFYESGSDSNLSYFVVHLRNKTQTISMTDTTEADGIYEFLGIPSDTFDVYIEMKMGWTLIQPTSGLYNIFHEYGAQTTDLNFCLYTDSTNFRTLTQAEYAAKSVRIKKKSGVIPMPTGGNVRDTVRYKMGWKKNGLPIGVAKIDSAFDYGWLLIKTQNFKTTLPLSGPARGFDKYGTKPFVGQKKKLDKRNHDNHLAAEQMILKYNLAASDLGITPLGIGGLIYDDTTYNPCKGLTVREIVRLVDSALTLYKWQRFSSDPNYFRLLDTCVSRINKAFAGPIDTIDTSPLQVKGMRSLYEISYLRPNPFSSATVIPPQVDDRIIELPSEFVLDQNYPNPFNPTTTINFTIGQISKVNLKVYNVLGEEVAMLLDNQVMDEDDYELEFNGADLASGVYFYRLVAEKITDQDEMDEEFMEGKTYMQVKKMILIR